jgi:hypothetical protein
MSHIYELLLRDADQRSLIKTFTHCTIIPTRWNSQNTPGFEAQVIKIVKELNFPKLTEFIQKAFSLVLCNCDGVLFAGLIHTVSITCSPLTTYKFSEYCVFDLEEPGTGKLIMIFQVEETQEILETRSMVAVGYACQLVNEDLVKISTWNDKLEIVDKMQLAKVQTFL